MTAWRPGRRGEPDELLVSRRDANGQLHYAGGVRFGLTASERVCLRGVLKRLEEPVSGRANVRPVQPFIEVDVDYHGQPGGPLRDPVVRNVAVAEQPRSSHTYPLTTLLGGQAS